jgi:cytochrome b6-f complex iron-sulfur subunit
MSGKDVKERFAATRRFFLNLSLSTILIALLGWFLYPIIKFLIPPAKTSIDPNILSIPLAQIPCGKSLITKYKGRPIIIVNRGNEVHALSAVCTHLGCLVKWDSNKEELFCPCHMAKYDINGNVKSGPAPKALFTFKTNLVNDQIIVEEV